MPVRTRLEFDSLLWCLFVFVPRRVMGMRSCDSRCLFSGSKGEVCSIEPLNAPPDFRDHPITQYSLLAMASLTKVHKHTKSSILSPSTQRCARLWCFCTLVYFHQILVIGLKPSLKVWMTFPYSKVCVSVWVQIYWYSDRVNAELAPESVLRLLN